MEYQSQPGMDSGEPGGMPGEAEPMPSQNSGQIHIPSDMLPEGMGAKCKPGDTLVFKVTAAADGDGDVPVEYESWSGGEGHEAEGSWEDGLRSKMSPRAGEDEIQSM